MARFFAGRTAIAGLRVEASEGPFGHGSGDLVRGPTLALVLAMAGRVQACADLDGDGVAVLRGRLGSGPNQER